MDKQALFELAKNLRAGGLGWKKVGEVVGKAAGRANPYAGNTMCTWGDFENYKEYSECQRERMTKYKAELQKETTKPEEFDGANSIVAVLKAIEHEQQRIVVALDKIVEHFDNL